jgi:hypothetical protein
MAITRAQQAKQLLKEGGRTGFKKGRDTDYQQRGQSKSSYAGSTQQQNFSARDDGPSRSRIQDEKQQEFVRNQKEFVRNQIKNLVNKQQEEKAFEPYESLIVRDSGLPGLGGTLLDALKGPRQFMLNKNIDYFRGLKSRGRLNDPRYTANAQGYKNYMSDRLAGKIDAAGNLIMGGDDNNNMFLPVDTTFNMASSDMDQGTDTTEEEPFMLSRAFRADGGRMGFFLGGNFNQTQEQKQRDINISRNEAGGGGGGDGPKTTPIVNPVGSNEPAVNPIFNKALREPELQLEAFIKKMELENRIKEEDDEEENMAGGILVDSIRNVPELKQRISAMDDAIKSANLNFAGGGIAAGYAEGGPVGGIMDLESGRQMYFLGKLVKKATRAVKKIAKSPIGKAALLGIAGFGIPGTSFGGLLGRSAGIFGKATPGIFNTFGPTSALKKLGILKSQMEPGLFERVGPLSKIFDKIPGGGVTAAIAGASAVAGALTPDEENQAQQIADSTGFSIEEARNQILAARQDDFRARAFKAGGGLMRLGYQEGGDAEPVAKKTMPLLDMDGKEKDYRETGGFVDMGRMERADDVPARLSKNEFVFTADAVRNAGDGSVDKGAEVMYNMMKNLEAGGEVSEESQGLEGARKMFQTSQRLEEVI